jgi:hypothetical protein
MSQPTMARPPANGDPQQRMQTMGRRGLMAGSTEARPGIITTEFWLSVATAATTIIAGYVSDAFSVDAGWALGAGVIAAYALSRGFAKSGSREGPFMLDITDQNR